MKRRNVSAVSVLGLAMAGCSPALAVEGGSAAYTLTGRPIPGCPGGQALTATLPFQKPEFRSRYELVVFNTGLKTVEQARAAIQAQGWKVVALVNGGFFGSRIFSYFRSTRSGVQNPSNSALSPRACMTHDHGTGESRAEQSTPENYQKFQSLPNSDVFCAGPQLVEGGQDVSERQFCQERFDPRCRPDGSDPGLGYHVSFPRTASCRTRAGELKFFVFASETQRCGSSLSDLAQAMISEGCEEGMNHDGGSSTKAYFENGNGPAITVTGAPNESDRTVPVWIAVVKVR